MVLRRDLHETGVIRGRNANSFYYRPRDIFANLARQSHHRPEYCNFDVGFRVARMGP